MSLVYSLKLLTDILFYMTFAGLISALVGAVGREMGNSGLLSTLPFLLVSILLLGVLAEKGRLKYAAFLPLIGAVAAAFNYGLIHLILLGPACAYIIYYATTLPYDIKTVGHAVVFRMYLIITLPICIFFSANFTFFGAFMNGVMGPYLIMYVAASIVLMRMIRHDTEVLNQRRFRIMNSLSVGAVVLAGLFLGSNRGVALMLGLLSFIYFRLFIPLLYLMLLAVGLILYPFAMLFGLEPWDVPWPGQDQPDGDGEWAEIIAEQPDPGIGYTIFQIAVYASLAVAAFFLLRALFRFLTQKQLVRDSKGVNIERTAMPDVLRQSRRKEPRVNHQIRQVYRKFLKLCRNRGITLYPSLTTEDIAKSFSASVGDSKDVMTLREIYIDSRYGEKKPKSADVKECKEIYSKLKKMGTGRVGGDPL